MAYRKWVASEITFTLFDELTDKDVVTIAIMTPDGVMTIMGEPREEARSLIVERVHVSSIGLGPNSVGLRNLRLIANVIRKKMGYVDIFIEGEVRTTGANPGRRPCSIRLT